MDQLVWLITGCSTGIGLELSKAVIARGDKVIATARAPVSRLSGLEAAGADILELDVANEQDIMNATAIKAVEIHGRIDVLVCNAGYGEMGVLEDINAERWTNQLAANLFGAINVANAFLPHFRGRKSGTIAFISSVYAHVVVPGGGAYTVSKHAMNGYAKSLAVEVEQFNIKPIIFDLGFVHTPIIGNFKITPPKISDYAPMGDVMQKMRGAVLDNEPGDPVQCANRIVDMVKSEGLAAGPPTPMSVPLGTDAYLMVKVTAERMLKHCAEWEALSRSVDYRRSRQRFFADWEHYA